MKPPTLFVPLLLLAIVPPAWAILPPARPRLPNIDKREPAQPAAAAGPQQLNAVAALRARAPGVRVDLDPITGGPAMVSGIDGLLTGPNGEGKTVSTAALAAIAADDPDGPAKAFLTEHKDLFGFGPEALANARVQRQFTSAHNGLRTMVWQQQVDGIAVFEGVLIAHTTKAGELVNISSRFMRDGDAAASLGTPNRSSLVAAPGITPGEAIAIAARNVGDEAAAGQVSAAGEAETGPEKAQRFKAAFLRGEAQARLIWLPMDPQRLRLCWEAILTSRQRAEMFRTLVDAATGDVLIRYCLTEYITDATYNVFTSDSPSPFSPGYSTPLTTQPPLVSRSLVTLSALDTNASPLGWISDGVNETQGNNVDAHTDRNDDDLPDLPRPQGSPYRVFNFPMDLSTQDPTNYSQAAVVQLFYLCNWMHDRLYQLGFTEATGNFQNNNFGRGGLGNDALQADAQDGGGTDNANMSTPPDGSAPRMQMYIFTGPYPRRDGDLDAEVVLHEYTHGLSNRRVGGGVGISALQTEGMGEGWSDWYALSLLSEPGDDVDACYASGGYASYLLSSGYNQNYYFGIRRYPFSTDMTKNPLTFKDIDPGQASAHTGIPRNPVIGTTANEVHNMGEVWCVTLWEVRAALIHKIGYDLGNQLALQLATDAMNLSPANPNFVQARDAILQADVVDDAGTNRNSLWAAFAKRGLGASATSPPSSTSSGLVEAYDVPDNLQITPSILGSSGPVGGPFSPNPGYFTLTNAGATALTWSLANTSIWFSVSPSSGTLTPGGPATTVSVTIGASANGFPLGIYSGAVWFTNQASGVAQVRQFTLSVVGRNMFDDFDPGIDMSQWSAFGGVVGSTLLATNYGGSISGANSLWFGDAGSRFATTMPINTSSGGTVSFYIRLANGAAWPWEEVDYLPYEGVVLEASINGGSTWTTLGNYDTTAYYAWTPVTMSIPPSVQSSATLFRWRQLSHSGASFDHWALDNVTVDAGPTPPTIYTQPADARVAAGGTASFTVLAVGSSPLSYQWRFNGGDLTGATTSSLILANVQSNQAGFYSVQVTNQYGSVTSSSAQLIMVDRSSAIAVFTDPTYIDTTGGGSSSEGINVQASLTNLGYTITTFSNINAAVTTNHIILIPEQERRALANDLSAATKATLANFVMQGGVLIVHGGENGAGSLLNAVFGWGITESGQIYTGGPTYSLTPQANGTVFAGGPATLPCNNGTSTLTGLPPGALDIYDYSGQSAVAQIPYGGGAVIFLGWDWYDAYPVGAANGGWLPVLGSAVTASTPTAPKILSQPQSQSVVLGENAWFSVAVSGAVPLSYQWSCWGTNLPGATNSSLLLTNVQYAQAGPYAVLVTNNLGSVLSSNAVLTVNPPPPCLPPAAGLISWWRVEDNPADQTGGNNGVLVGNAGYGYGRVGRALVLDGSGDMLSVGPAANLQLQDFTIEAWIRRSSSSVVTYGSHGTAVFFGYGSGGYGFGINNSGQLFLSKIDIDNVTLGTSISDTNFHHVAVTKAGIGVTFFIDGIASSTFSYPSTFSFGTGAALGARADTMDDSFLGCIDELAVYNRNLSPVEVQAIYAAGASGKCAAPGPPAIYAQPIDQNVFAGGTALFTVGASGTAPLKYQWFFNGAPLAQATNSVFTLASAGTNQSGPYIAVVTNDYGAVTSRVATLSVVTVSPSRVAVLGAPSTMSFNDDVRAKLANSGAFTQVDAFYIGSGYPLPTLSDLMKYTAVLVYTDGGFSNGSALGDLLADYVDQGGGVVLATFAFTSGLNVGGRFTGAGYAPLTIGSQNQGIRLNLVSDVPGHALLAGVNRFNGGTSSFHCSPVTVSSGAQLVAHWDNGQPLVATKRPSVGFVVALNFFPPSSDVRSDLWDAGSDGARLMANALLWASQGAVPTPPVIVSQPASQTVLSGSPALFTVSGWGSPPITYQWRFNGAPIPGATGNQLSFNAVYPTNGGAYSVVLSNNVGTATSADATLTVYVPPAPVITLQPQSQTVPAGTNATLTVAATDSWSFTYQWFHNGNPVAGATDTALNWYDVQATNAGEYFAVVANAWSAATSSVAVLTVVPSAPFFSIQPQSQAVFPGYSMLLSAMVSGTEPLQWQWQFYGTNLPFANSTGYGVVMEPTKAGPYRVIVSNEVGYAMSDLAVVGISPIAPWGLTTATLPLECTNAVSLSAGGWHTVALRRDGSVVAWGQPDLTNAPPDLTNVVAVSAGGTHSLALRADGTVVGWGGANTYGQTNIPSWLGNVVSIAAGNSHCLALKSDGTVSAWGYNAYGQCSVPFGLTNVVAIAAGGNHSLALQASGKVNAWGDNSSRQCTVPSNLTDVVSIQAGSLHSVALKADGTVIAWGDNAYGQTNVPAGLSNVVALDGGYYHTLALKQDGTIAAWGAGTNTDMAGPYPHFGQCVVPAAVSNASAVVAGALYSMAFASDAAPFISEPPVSRFSYSGRRVLFRAAATGALPLQYQWQLNDTDIPGATNQILTIENATTNWAGLYRVVVRNQAGVATSTEATLTLLDRQPLVISQPVARPVYLGGQLQLQVGVDGSGPFSYQWRLNGVDIAGATGATLLLNHVLANQAGSYSVVVSNAFGGVSSAKTSLAVLQMAAWGAGTNYTATPNLGQAVIPAGLSGVTGVAGGGYHTLVQKNDGRILAWGAGTNYSTLPNLGQSIVPAGLSNVVSVAGGLFHTLALKSDGTVLAWGAGTSNSVSPNYGQCMVPIGLNNAVGIAAGDYHSVALKNDGRVAIWGGGSYFISLTNPPPFATNFVAIASRGSHVLGLRGDGGLVHWGNIGGAPFVSNVVAIAVGQNHCLALRNDGTVTSWGSQTVVPPGLTNVVDIAAGFEFSLALRQDGTVVVWGGYTNQYGLSLVPAGLTNVIGIACGNYHCLAFLGDGSPVIKYPPANAAAYVGGTASFRAGALGAQPMSYQWQANGTNLIGATNLVLTMTNLQAADAGAYRVVVTNVFGCVTSAVATLNVLVPLGQALDATNLSWSASGNAAWFGETNITHDGMDAAQSGRLLDAQQSSLQTSVSGPGTLSFWWKVSSEQWFDFLTFYIDNQPQASISGEIDWQPQTFAVGSGLHSLRWTYAKDASVSVGADAGWVDQVSYLINPPLITVQPLSQNAMMGDSVVLLASASGMQPITFQWLKNGTNLPGCTGSSYSINCATRRDSGIYAFTASNPGGTTVSSNALLTVHVPQKLGPLARLPGGGFMLLSDDADGGCLLPEDLAKLEPQASTNLVDWITLTNCMSLTNGALLIADPGCTNHPARYYRILEHW